MGGGTGLYGMRPKVEKQFFIIFNYIALHQRCVALLSRKQKRLTTRRARALLLHQAFAV